MSATPWCLREYYGVDVELLARTLAVLKTTCRLSSTAYRRPGRLHKDADARLIWLHQLITILQTLRGELVICVPKCHVRVRRWQRRDEATRGGRTMQGYEY